MVHVLNINPYAATHDKLTGLPNSFLFYDRVNVAIASDERTTSRSAVALIKIRELELIRRTQGDSIGDILLLRVTERLSKSLREGDTIGKLDDCDFGILFTQLSSKDCIFSLTSRIKHIVSEPYHINKATLDISLDIGLSIYPDDGINAHILARHAFNDLLDF